MTHHILSSRLNEAFLPKPVKVELPSANLNDIAADGLAVSLNLLEPAENNIWLKFGKNWGADLWIMFFCRIPTMIMCAVFLPSAMPGRR